MNISELIQAKTELRDEYKSTYSLPRRSKILIGVHFTDSSITNAIIDGLWELPANFIIFGKDINKSDAKNICYSDDHSKIDMKGIDAMLCNCDDIKLEEIMKLGTVPIINNNNYLWKILQEFHPGRAEGNSYIYENNSYWSAYYALVRYLENHKFPYDNRNLVKNVAWL